MSMKCQICHEPAEQIQVVVYNKEKNSKTGYLVMDNQVLFDSSKIAKFLYFCATKGLRLKNRDILDLCESCLRNARIDMN